MFDLLCAHTNSRLWHSSSSLSLSLSISCFALYDYYYYTPIRYFPWSLSLCSYFFISCRSVVLRKIKHQRMKETRVRWERQPAFAGRETHFRMRPHHCQRATSKLFISVEALFEQKSFISNGNDCVDDDRDRRLFALFLISSITSCLSSVCAWNWWPLPATNGTNGTLKRVPHGSRSNVTSLVFFSLSLFIINSVVYVNGFVTWLPPVCRVSRLFLSFDKKNWLLRVWRREGCNVELSCRLDLQREC